MADAIKQLVNMVANLKITVEEGFETVDKRFKTVDKRFEDMDKRFEDMNKRFEDMNKRFDTVEVAIQELNTNQIRILNSMKLLENDVRNNKKHIERLEERESFL